MSVFAALAAAGAVAARWPFVGLLAYLWMDFMRPHDMWVELRAWRPMLAIGLITLLATAWQRREHLLDGTGGLVPLVLLIFATAVSAALGMAPQRATATLVELTKMLALVWLLASLVTSERRLGAVLWVIALSLGVLAVGAIAQGVERGLMHDRHMALAAQGPLGLHDGVYRDNNDLARVLAMALPLWWALGWIASRYIARAAAAVGFALTVVAIEYTFSRSGLIAMLAAVAALALAARPRWRGGLAFAAFAALLFVCSPQPYVDRIATIAHPLADNSFQGRLSVWSEVLRAAREHPLRGRGPGTFQLGDQPSTTPVRRAPHNIFVEVFTEQGALGLAAYGAVLAAAFLWLRRARRPPVEAVDPLRTGGRGSRRAVPQWGRRLRGSVALPTERLRSLSIGLQSALVALLTAGLALGGPYRSPLFVLYGLALALSRMREAGDQQ